MNQLFGFERDSLGREKQRELGVGVEHLHPVCGALSRHRSPVAGSLDGIAPFDLVAADLVEIREQRVKRSG